MSHTNFQNTSYGIILEYKHDYGPFLLLLLFFLFAAVQIDETLYADDTCVCG